MWISTLFCSRANEASLKSLRDVVSKLLKETNASTQACWNQKSNVESSEFNSIGNNTDINHDNNPNSCYIDYSRQEKVENIPVNSGGNDQSTQLNWGELPGKLLKLYDYLNKNKSSYYSGYITKISEKSEMMVNAIRDYYEEKDEEEKKIKLARARTAIDDFHNAFKLSQTKNMILAGLVVAIIGAILVLFAGPLSIPAVVAGLKTGTIGTVIGGSGGAMMVFAGLRNLFFGDIANLKELADGGRKAAEDLLLSPLLEENKNEKIPIRSKNANNIETNKAKPGNGRNANSEYKRIKSPTHQDNTSSGISKEEGDSEEGMVAYLCCLLSSLYKSSWRPPSHNVTHENMTGTFIGQSPDHYYHPSPSSSPRSR